MGSNYIRDFDGLPYPPMEGIPRVMVDYLKDLHSCLSAYLSELSQYLNNEVQTVKNRLEIGSDSYVIFNSDDNRLEFYIDDTLEGYLDPTTGWVSV